MQELIRDLIAPLYAGGFAPDHDGAIFDLAGRLAFTSDSYVVQPLFFPGGDIGQLAIYGTVNDLAMCGASPLYLSCAFILEEGLPLDTLRRVCASLAAAAHKAQVQIVTGDTKVVGRGQADGLFINTSGVGIVRQGIEVHPRLVEAGDILILSGDLGRHGIAIMAARSGFGNQGELASDCTPLAAAVASLLDAGVHPKCLRDLTRGGLASALHEISESAKIGVEIDEAKIPVHSKVRAVCEILGLDPLYIANEGRFLAVVSPADLENTLDVLGANSETKHAVRIGIVNSSREVEIRNSFGSLRILPAMQGELLSRIC